MQGSPSFLHFNRNVTVLAASRPDHNSGPAYLLVKLSAMCHIGRAGSTWNGNRQSETLAANIKSLQSAAVNSDSVFITMPADIFEGGVTCSIAPPPPHTHTTLPTTQST
jgi:hypothetical protein